MQRQLSAAARELSRGSHAFPSRHSDLGTASLSVSGTSGGMGGRNVRQPNSWGPWSGSTNINAGRYILYSIWGAGGGGRGGASLTGLFTDRSIYCGCQKRCYLLQVV